ncbi:uncharacterized protein L199_001400 [Kwoniella botswanensis]|uniref:uncharacterized protein n=1 Tax=Kwoniella botswanensis TaxID=1268659 RepID=UPI00315D8CCB
MNTQDSEEDDYYSRFNQTTPVTATLGIPHLGHSASPYEDLTPIPNIVQSGLDTNAIFSTTSYIPEEEPLGWSLHDGLIQGTPELSGTGSWGPLHHHYSLQSNDISRFLSAPAVDSSIQAPPQTLSLPLAKNRSLTASPGSDVSKSSSTQAAKGFRSLSKQSTTSSSGVDRQAENRRELETLLQKIVKSQDDKDKIKRLQNRITTPAHTKKRKGSVAGLQRQVNTLIERSSSLRTENDALNVRCKRLESQLKGSEEHKSQLNYELYVSKGRIRNLQRRLAELGDNSEQSLSHESLTDFPTDPSIYPTFHPQYPGTWGVGRKWTYGIR